jgi:hypothetical protein
MLLWVLARPWTPEQPNLVRAMHDLTYLLGGPAHVLMLGLFVAAGAASLPRDVGAPAALRSAGFAGAAVSLLSVIALLFDPASLLLPIGRGLAMLWIAGVAVTVAWSARARERVVSRPSTIADLKLAKPARLDDVHSRPPGLGRPGDDPHGDVGLLRRRRSRFGEHTARRGRFDRRQGHEVQHGGVRVACWRSLKALLPQPRGAPHNVAIYRDSSAAQKIFVGETITDTAITYEVPALEAGEYFFRCDVHPEMTGTVTTGG